MKFLFFLLLLGVNAGVFAAPKGDWRVLETFEVGANVYVRAFAVEKAKNRIWVGTSLGVHEIDLKSGQRLNTFTRDHGLANEYVFAIGIDVDGNKWFGTNAGGMSRYKDGKWKTVFPMHGLADYWIYAFANDKGGNLWIGTWAGVNRLDRKTGKLTTYVKELINEWVYGIDVDSKNRIWFGTEGGISMFDGKKWKSWTQKDGLGASNGDNRPASANTGLGTRSRHDLGLTTEAGVPTFNPNYVFAVHVDQHDVVWAGTWGGGVARYDGKKWSNLTTRNGLAGNVVFSIARDNEGAMWFGTDQGVSRYDGKTWKNFGRREGLLGDNVYALAVTPSGEVWAGTKRGASRLGRK